MKLSDRQEEILETLWVHHNESEKKAPIDLGVAKAEPEINELLKQGYIKLVSDKIILTEKGSDEGEKVIRRHRLAERLFSDVLDIKQKLVHPLSCQFEHLLHEGIEDNICILLGHPRTCPHGKPIPKGECCRKFKENITKVVSSVVNLKTNQKGKVAYIHTQDNHKLQKLMAMGILPGASLTLIQNFPSYVLQVRQSQFAIDKELAECVFVRTTG